MQRSPHMAYTYEELKKKTVADLREIAKGIESEDVKGATQMNKDQLLAHICKALNIDTHVHHEVKGLDKTSIKSKMKELKIEREKLMHSGDKVALAKVRKSIHDYKRTLRKAMV